VEVTRAALSSKDTVSIDWRTLNEVVHTRLNEKEAGALELTIGLDESREANNASESCIHGVFIEISGA
jgi:hypothetical protein